MQSEFGEDLCKLFVAIRAPWNSANNPQAHIFFQKWVPGAVVPDRRTLSGPILDQEVAKVEESLKLKLQGRLASFIQIALLLEAHVLEFSLMFCVSLK